LGVLPTETVIIMMYNQEIARTQLSHLGHLPSFTQIQDIPSGYLT
jgi:hypothetical protein